MIAPSDDALGAIAYPLAIEVLRERGGLVFASPRRKTIESALGRVMQRVGILEPGRFAAALAESGPVFDEVMALVTVGETYFFREPAQFAFLRERVFPEIIARGGPSFSARVWSAACATGEETYSLAIAASEAHVDASILGTDVSRARLAAARRGRYREWSMRGLDRSRINRYFSRIDAEYAITASFRRQVRFAYLNLAADTYPSPTNDLWGFDVIFCRNVLIYFDAATIARVASQLIDCLSTDGYLFLGASDPPLFDVVDCELLQTPAGFVYRKATGKPRRWQRPAQIPFPARAAIASAPPSPPPPVPVVPVAATAEIAPAPDEQTLEQADWLREAFRARRYREAAKIGQAMLDVGDDNVDGMILTIRALANAGDMHDAERVCGIALDRHGDVAELRHLMAMLLLQAGHPRAAATEARRAIYLDRTLGAAYLTLADALERLGDAAGARQALLRVERLLRNAADSSDRTMHGEESPTRLLAIARARLERLSEPLAE